MPERLDRVKVTTSRGFAELPWDSRGSLLDEIRHLDPAAGIAKAFSDVGASRPVTLSDEDRADPFSSVLIADVFNLNRRPGAIYLAI